MVTGRVDSDDRPGGWSDALCDMALRLLEVNEGRVAELKMLEAAEARIKELEAELKEFKGAQTLLDNLKKSLCAQADMVWDKEGRCKI
jgi:hypothetical protein